MHAQTAPPSRRALRSIENIVGHGRNLSHRDGAEKEQVVKPSADLEKVLVLDARTGRPWQADRAPLAAQEDLAWLDDVCNSPQKEEEEEEEEGAEEEEGEEGQEHETVKEEEEAEEEAEPEKEEVQEKQVEEEEEEEDKDLLGLEPITPARTRQTMSRPVPPPVNPLSSTFSALPSRMAPPPATHPSMPPPPPATSATPRLATTTVLSSTSTASSRGLITSAAASSSSPPPSSSTSAPSNSTHPPSGPLGSAPAATRIFSGEGGSDAPSQSAVSSGSIRPLLSSSSVGSSTRQMRCFSVE